MKKLSSFALTGMIVLATGSCSDADVYDPDAVRPNDNPLQLVAPEGFDWKMTNQIGVTVDVEDLYNGEYSYLIEVFPRNPETNPDLLPMAAGYASQSQTYATSIVLPDTYTEFYLRQTTPAGQQSVTACALSGEDESVYYQFSDTQTKSNDAATRAQTPNYPIEIDATGGVPYTFCFEDQWPNYGDFDMNDVVLTITELKKADTGGRRLRLTAELRAVGASKKIGLGVQFKGLTKDLPYNKIEVEDSEFGNTEIEGLFEPKCTQPCFIIFDNVHYSLNGQQDYAFINTIAENKSTNSARKINIYIDLENGNTIPDEAININNIDFFIVIGTDSEGKRIEVHAPGYEPTGLGSKSLYGQGNDNSNAGTPYLSEDNLCWAFVVPAEFAWPVEYQNIKDAYHQFEKWVTSGGQNDQKWYEHYKDADKVYTK